MTLRGQMHRVVWKKWLSASLLCFDQYCRHVEEWVCESLGAFGYPMVYVGALTALDLDAARHKKNLDTAPLSRFGNQVVQDAYR